jgi:hypothetical protein
VLPREFNQSFDLTFTLPSPWGVARPAKEISHNAGHGELIGVKSSFDP